MKSKKINQQQTKGEMIMKKELMAMALMGTLSLSAHSFESASSESTGKVLRGLLEWSAEGLDITAEGVSGVGEWASDGLKSAGKGVAKGAKAVDKGVAKGAKAVGRGVAKGTKAVGRGVAKGTKTAGKDLSDASDWTGDRLNSTSEGLSSQNLKEEKAFNRLVGVIKNDLDIYYATGELTAQLEAQLNLIKEAPRWNEVPEAELIEALDIAIQNL